MSEVANTGDTLTEFLIAACVPRSRDHSSGTIDGAKAILAAHPEVGRASIYAAAVLGDDVAVRQFLAADPAGATAKGGPHEWDALTYLCFSNYLKLDRARTDGFVRAATALLEAGASPNTGWMEQNHRPESEWEPVLYGACGVAHHPELTRLLLEHGANPNDGEVVYHAPETYDNDAMKLLVETGKLTAENLSLMLIRKHDWHDYEGAKYLLEHGADPKGPRERGWLAIHHALARDNNLNMFELLLDYGADPTARNVHRVGGDVSDDQRTVVELAARRGRGDVLALFKRRGIPITLHGLDELIGACAMNDGATVQRIAASEPELVRALLSEGAGLLAAFTGTGNVDGVRQLLDLGVPVAELNEGDSYFGTPKNSTPLHVAAWRAHPAIVKLLLERGAPPDGRDGRGDTPLALAVRACVNSYWTRRRSPDSVETLLRAGASVRGISFPCGYAEVDDLLRQHGAGA